MERRWDLIIFDCDGVLVDSEPITCRVFTEHLRRIGFETDLPNTMRAFAGLSMAESLERIEARLGRPVPGGFADDYEAEALVALRREIRPMPHVHEMLDRTESIAPVAVASTGRLEKMEVTLGVTGLRSRFDGRIFSATGLARGKPFPDVYLHAARSCGADPARCAVVEDTETGVRAALAAGMSVLGFIHLDPVSESIGLDQDPATLGTEIAARVVGLVRAGARVFDDLREVSRLLQEGPEGRVRRPIEVVPHDPAWADGFRIERDRILNAIREACSPALAETVRVEHIGSTSVSGLAAKPILDFMVGLPSLSHADQVVPALVEELGYRYVPAFEDSLPERRYLRKDTTPAGGGTARRTHHVHMTATSNSFWQRHLRFRDRLRNDFAAARAYGQLKLDLAAALGDDLEAYTVAKGGFIRALERDGPVESG